MPDAPIRRRCCVVERPCRLSFIAGGLFYCSPPSAATTRRAPKRLLHRALARLASVFVVTPLRRPPRHSSGVWRTMRRVLASTLPASPFPMGSRRNAWRSRASSTTRASPAHIRTTASLRGASDWRGHLLPPGHSPPPTTHSGRWATPRFGFDVHAGMPLPRWELAAVWSYPS